MPSSGRPSELAALRGFIHQRLGIQMPAEKIPLLAGRLQARLRALGLRDLAEYETHVLRGGQAVELSELAQTVPTHKTDFWREPVQFPILVEHLRTAGSTPIRVWCAGCSTGEEAYTLAMVLAEEARQHRGWDFGVLATDVSPRVLAHARRGIYEAARVEPLPAPLREAWVLQARDPRRRDVRIAPELRARVAFRELNFMAPDYDVPGGLDAVFFRNVAIYFDAPTQRSVTTKLLRALRSGGLLFLGQSESLVSGVGGLERVGPSVYRRREPA